MYIYYVYAYLRSKDSKTAKAGTPYYIGKGKGNRAWAKHRVPLPDSSMIVLLETGLSEIGALALERRLIRWHGRVNKGTGILRNLSDGGEGSSGAIKIITPEWRKKLSNANLGKKRSTESVNKQVASMIGKKRPPRSKEWIDKQKLTLANKTLEERALTSDKIKAARAARTPEQVALTSDKLKAAHAARTPEQVALIQKKILASREMN